MTSRGGFTAHFLRDIRHKQAATCYMIADFPVKKDSHE
jgi:hypothetical protein